MVNLAVLHQHERRARLWRGDVERLIGRRLLRALQEYGKLPIGFKDGIFYVRKLKNIFAAQLFHQVGQRIARAPQRNFLHYAAGYQNHALPADQLAYAFAFERKKRDKLLQQEQCQNGNDAINQRNARV